MEEPTSVPPVAVAVAGQRLIRRLRWAADPHSLFRRGIGVLFVVLTQRAHLAPLLMAGFLGGFTTFSAFSLDALKLWEGGLSAQAAAYVAASVILSLAAVALGAALARSVGA